MKPWELAKLPELAAALHDVCTVRIEAFRLLTIYLKPVLPALAARVKPSCACRRSPGPTPPGA